MTTTDIEKKRKLMGWCPNVNTKTAGIIVPEMEIKDSILPWQRIKKNLCSGNTEVILIALIWASVIVAISTILEGTQYMNRVLPILGGGSFASILILNNIRKKNRERS
ncbi:Uncharacterised protein [uncultured archaeon]|nr:Uncharacterised protein [uncultured archaeon]